MQEARTLTSHSRHTRQMRWLQWRLPRPQLNPLRCSELGLSAQTAQWWPLPPALLGAEVPPRFHGPQPAEGAEPGSSLGRQSWLRKGSGDRTWAPVALC